VAQRRRNVQRHEIGLSHGRLSQARAHGRADVGEFVDVVGPIARFIDEFGGVSGHECSEPHVLEYSDAGPCHRRYACDGQRGHAHAECVQGHGAAVVRRRVQADVDKSIERQMVAMSLGAWNVKRPPATPAASKAAMSVRR
jgi:hypothetical protein